MDLVLRGVAGTATRAEMAIQQMRTNQACSARQRERELNGDRNEIDRSVAESFAGNNAKSQKQDSGKPPIPDPRVTMTAPTRNKRQHRDKRHDQQKDLMETVLPKSQGRPNRNKAQHEWSEKAVYETQDR